MGTAVISSDRFCFLLSDGLGIRQMTFQLFHDRDSLGLGIEHDDILAEDPHGIQQDSRSRSHQNADQQNGNHFFCQRKTFSVFHKFPHLLSSLTVSVDTE